MLTHDAVIWQYVSCIVDAGIAADDLMLHALPLYHCAQLDVFFGPAIYIGATNVITAQPTPDNLLPLIERYRHQFVLCAADGLDLAAALAAVRSDRSVQPAQGLLRRLDHAGRSAARTGAAPAEGAAVESLRPDRDRAAGDHARARGSIAQTRLVRTRRAQCRNPRRRRRDARRGARRGRRDRAPLAASDARLFPRRRTHRGGLRGRLVPLRRSRRRSTTRATSRWSIARRT